MTHDLVIRNGVVVDGTGAKRFGADVAINDGVITEVGPVTGAGRREIDADGQIVSPGWVDIHTHYDGQATWDRDLAPSSTHGVTSIVMGNCGVGFAPAQPDKHGWKKRKIRGQQKEDRYGQHPWKPAVCGHGVGQPVRERQIMNQPGDESQPEPGAGRCTGKS